MERRMNIKYIYLEMNSCQPRKTNTAKAHRGKEK